MVNVSGAAIKGNGCKDPRCCHMEDCHGHPCPDPFRFEAVQDKRKAP